MKTKSLIYSFFLVFIFILISCNVNDPNLDDFDNSNSENGIYLLSKNGTSSSPGEIKIINRSSQDIFIPYITYPDCFFSIYTMEQKSDSSWEGLIINEYGDKWIKKNVQDSILAICELYKNPIRINSGKSFKIELLQVEAIGEYRLTIYYRHSQGINPENPDKTISTLYLVK